MNPVLEVRHLHLMQTMAADCNLTRASQRLNLSQSALSAQLKELESRLGTELFLRVGRGLVVTPAGERVALLAQQVLPQLQSVELELLQQSSVLRIATECYSGYQWLPQVVRHFEKHWPKVQVSIAPASTGTSVQHLLEGKLELAISDVPVSHPDLASFPLFKDDLLVVLSAAHRMAARASIRLNDLAGETFFHYTIPAECGTLKALCEGSRLASQKFEVVPLTEALLEFVKAGMGFAILAQWAVRPYLRGKSLIALPVSPHMPARQWSAMTHRMLSEKPWVKDLIKNIARHAPSHS